MHVPHQCYMPCSSQPISSIRTEHLHDIWGACGVVSNFYHESCSCNSKSFPEKIYILPIPHPRLWMAYDQVMEKVESCVYENHVIPPARQEHKTQYILFTGIRFLVFIFQVNIKRLCLGLVKKKALWMGTAKYKKRCQHSNILNKIEICTVLSKDQKRNNLETKSESR